MIDDALLDLLNKFLFLEEGQVVLYSTLADKAPNEELNQGLRRLTAIEATHVENLKEKITLLFPQKDPANPLRTTMVGAGLDIFGGTVGIVKGVVGLKNLMKAGVFAETKAIAEYRQALTKIKNPQLRDMLWEHLIDEELHLLWLDKQTDSSKRTVDS